MKWLEAIRNFEITFTGGYAIVILIIIGTFVYLLLKELFS